MLKNITEYYPVLMKGLSSIPNLERVLEYMERGQCLLNGKIVSDGMG